MARRSAPAAPVDDRRRLQKFLDRSARALTGPVFELQDLSDPNGGVEMQLRMSVDDSGRRRIEFGFGQDVDDDALLAAITRCRPFLLKSEDVYLPNVVDSLLAQLPDAIRKLVAPLKPYVDSRIKDGNLSAPHWHTFTTALPEGTDDATIARSYIYGYAVKDDDDKRRLIDTLGAESRTVKDAVLAQLIQLMKIIQTIRTQLQIFTNEGTITLQVEASSTPAAST